MISVECRHKKSIKWSILNTSSNPVLFTSSISGSVSTEAVCMGKCRVNTREVKDTSKWSSFRGIFSQRRREENETRKRADILLSRIFHYIECYEFVHNLNMPEDFLRLQAAANIHLWLLVQRLRHFSVSSFSIRA